jgi:hypothetical protein
MYEGDSLIHPAPSGAGKSTAPTPEPAVAKRRSEALRGFFPQLAVWLNNRIHFSRMREIERYLAQATDLVDLEHRIAKIERSAQWH